MGAGVSRPPPRPWDVWDLEDEKSADAATRERASFPEPIATRIQALSESADTFLKAADDSFDFNVDDEFCLARMEGAMMHDKRLSQWLPKLVPKRVTEAQFWRNYFANVAAIAGRTDARVASKAPTAVASDPVVENAAAVPKTPVKTPPSVDAPRAPNGTAVAVESKDPNGVSTAISARDRAALEAQKREAAEEKARAAAMARTANDVHSSVARSPVGAAASSSAPKRVAAAPVQEEERVVQDYRLRHEEPLQEPPGQPQSLPIRWGIIGCGAVCEIKSGPAFRKVPGSRLVAVMRRTEELAADYAKRHGVPKYYTSAKALINDVEVDAVYIATPPGLHCTYALQVCAAGKPCYVEKPMARHYEECRVMVEQFYRAGLPLFVGYYRRRLDRFIAAKQIVTRFLGTITSVSYVNTRKDHIPGLGQNVGWRADPEQSGGGLFMDIGSHVIDILDFLLGPLLHVTGDAATHPTADPNLSVETNVTMTFRTQSGGLGTAMWNFCSASYTDRLAINGTQGSLSMSVFGKDGPVLHLPNGRSIEYEHTYPEHVHQPLVESIVQQLRGVPVPEDRLSTGVSAARTALIMDTVLRKFYKSRQDHFWKRPNTWESSKP